MKELPADLTGRFEIVVEPKHTADALGNVGMKVFATPFVVWIIEAAAYEAVAEYMEAGEGVAGTHIDLRHLAPTAVGRRVLAEARLVERKGRRLTFQATVSSGGQVVAEGSYTSVVVDPAQIIATAAAS